MRSVNFGYYYDEETAHLRAMKALKQMKALEAEKKREMTTVVFRQHTISYTPKGEDDVERLVNEQ